VREFIRTRGVTSCHPRSAAGTGWHKPTVSGNPREETAWLIGKTDVKSSEENLAKAKILTMLENLAGKTKELTQRSLRRDESYRWFFEPRSDFEDWCDTAGFDPDYVREQAKKVYEEGLPQWRAAPGQGKRYEERRTYRLRTAQQRIDA